MGKEHADARVTEGSAPSSARLSSGRRPSWQHSSQVGAIWRRWVREPTVVPAGNDRRETSQHEARVAPPRSPDSRWSRRPGVARRGLRVHARTRSRPCARPSRQLRRRARGRLRALARPSTPALLMAASRRVAQVGHSAAARAAGGDPFALGGGRSTRPVAPFRRLGNEPRGVHREGNADVPLHGPQQGRRVWPRLLVTVARSGAKKAGKRGDVTAGRAWSRWQLSPRLGQVGQRRRSPSASRRWTATGSWQVDSLYVDRRPLPPSRLAGTRTRRARRVAERVGVALVAPDAQAERERLGRAHEAVAVAEGGPGPV